MKISRIETYTDGTIAFVRLVTDDGAEGFGQIAPYNADIAAAVLHRQVAPHVLGTEVEQFDDLVDTLFDRNHKFPWSYVARAVGGVDTAVWDLRGKEANKSVCELLGGAPRAIAAYGSSMRRDITPAQEAERLKRLAGEEGFGAFKIRIGSECGRDRDAWPGRTEQIVSACREAIGPDMALLVDANSCYAPARAIEVGRLLEDHSVGHFEEPCPYWELEWTAEVAAVLDVPIAGGEQDNDLAQWRRMIRMDAVDIVQPDVCYVGGITRAMRVAKMAEQAGKPCVPHSANLSMVTLFALHLLAAIPNAGDYLEFTIDNPDWATNLFAPALEVRDGTVAVPEGPVWGVTVSPAWLDGASRQVSELD